jgi:hypothetical protein
VERDGTQILSLAADGSGGVKKLATFPVDSGAVPTSSASDVVLVQHRVGTNSGTDIASVPVNGGSPAKVLAGLFDEVGAALSPEGRLIAYVSNESGRNEVYLRPLAAQSGRLSIFTAGGTEPAWSPDGRELFYRNGREVLSVTFTNGKPQRLQQLFSRPSGARADRRARDKLRRGAGRPYPHLDLRPAVDRKRAGSGAELVQRVDAARRRRAAA